MTWNCSRIVPALKLHVMLFFAIPFLMCILYSCMGSILRNVTLLLDFLKDYEGRCIFFNCTLVLLYLSVPNLNKFSMHIQKMSGETPQFLS